MARATLKSNIPAAKAAVAQEADRMVLRLANLHRNKALERIMRGQKSGRVYGNHQASAPGEAPASDTGALVRSLRVDHSPGTLKASVVVASNYGAGLEFGTRRIAPRPYMRPAAEDVKKAVPELAKSVSIKVTKP